MRAPLAPTTCTLTAIVVSAGTVVSTGSLRTSAPAGTVTVGWPLKVTSRLLPDASAAALPVWRPTYTESKVTVRSPKTFEREIWTAGPPMLVRTRFRTVWSVNEPVTLSALAPHVTTWSGWAAVAAPIGFSRPRPRTAAAASGTTRRTVRPRGRR